ITRIAGLDHYFRCLVRLQRVVRSQVAERIIPKIKQRLERVITKCDTLGKAFEQLTAEVEHRLVEVVTASEVSESLRCKILQLGAVVLVVESYPSNLTPRDRKSTRLNSSHVKISYA